MIKKVEHNEMSLLIEQLEVKKRFQEQDLKNHLSEIYESIKPATIIKNTMHDLAIPFENDKQGMLQNLISIGTGFISKKLFMGKSTNPLKSLIGSFLEVKLANYISNKLGEK